MLERVVINKNLTIAIPDEHAMESIIKIYTAGRIAIDFMETRNRYVWLYMIMNRCVMDIENE